MRTRVALLALVLLVAPSTLAVLPAAPATASATSADVVSTRPPGVVGEAVVGQVLRAGPGGWEPTPASVSYRWLRDGEPVRGARDRTFALTADDVGSRLSVVVTATDASGATGRATSEPTDPVRRAVLVNRRAPRVHGVARYTRVLTADPGRWSATPDRVRYQWLRAGRPVPGATSRRYRIAPQDVGRRLRVQVTAVLAGHRRATSTSRAGAPVKHRVDVRRRATYSISTRGRVHADLGVFRRLVQETFADPRGWRGAGVELRRVRRGGSFTVVLAEASTLPSFSSGCSVEWSCRVGRNVVINQTRWLHASPAWNRAGRSLRDYRHMVVNHETGHWLGHGHASCPRPGALAPVMQQQSKGTQGCRLNPWPTAAELR